MDFPFPLLFQSWTPSAAFHKGWWDNQQSSTLFSSPQDLTLKPWCSSWTLLPSTLLRALLFQMLFPNRQICYCLWKLLGSCSLIFVGGSILSQERKITHLSVMETDWDFELCTFIWLDLMHQRYRGQLRCALVFWVWHCWQLCQCHLHWWCFLKKSAFMITFFFSCCVGQVV